MSRVTRVHKNVSRVGSGWPKWPRVGSNLGSGFDPTHPYDGIFSFILDLSRDLSNYLMFDEMRGGIFDQLGT